ncbi:hypothetical protein ABE438_17585 [Bosea sp. TWI1241]
MTPVAARLLLRRALWTLVETGCVLLFVAMVLTWAALGAGA